MGVDGGLLAQHLRGRAGRRTRLARRRWRRLLGPGGSRWLVPGGDELAFAHRVLELASNSSLRDTVGAANRERMAREFRVETMGERTAHLLLEGIAQDR